MKGLEFIPETHEYFYEGRKVPCVSDILEDAGYIDKRFFKPIYAERGKIIHTITQYYDEGDLDESSVDTEFAGWLEAYKTFRHDYKDRIEIIGIERLLYSPQYDYAGTADRFITIDGESGLIELKSGVPQAWHVLQLTGYSQCFGHAVPKKLYALYLKKDGTYKFVELKDPSARNAWLGAVASYHWKEKNMPGRK